MGIIYMLGGRNGWSSECFMDLCFSQERFKVGDVFLSVFFKLNNGTADPNSWEGTFVFCSTESNRIEMKFSFLLHCFTFLLKFVLFVVVFAVPASE